jgi:hypothetical protein
VKKRISPKGKLINSEDQMPKGMEGDVSGLLKEVRRDLLELRNLL